MTKNRLHVTNLPDNYNLINIIINRSLIKTVTVNSVKNKLSKADVTPTILSRNFVARQNGRRDIALSSRTVTKQSTTLYYEFEMIWIWPSDQSVYRPYNNSCTSYM